MSGEGAAGSEVMLVGEQPGDGEDRAGRPFVGPAGRVLDQALTEAGIDRDLAYVTNVVKHFKFERRGKLRRAQEARRRGGPRLLPLARGGAAPWSSPGSSSCWARPPPRPCSAARSGSAASGASSSTPTSPPRVLATVHPSSILRAPDEDARALAYKGFVADLAVVAEERCERAAS